MGTVKDGVAYTERDDSVIHWLDVARMADLEALQVVLGALGDPPRADGVGRKVAQTWVSRMVRRKVVDSTRRYLGTQLIRPTRLQTGRSPAHWDNSNASHSLEVARVTAALMARHGVTISRDLVQGLPKNRIADALLIWPNGARQYLEVEISTKAYPDLWAKHRDMAQRWADEGVSGTLYATRPSPHHAVAKAAREVLSIANLARLHLVPIDQLLNPAFTPTEHTPTEKSVD